MAFYDVQISYTDTRRGINIITEYEILICKKKNNNKNDLKAQNMRSKCIFLL